MKPTLYTVLCALALPFVFSCVKEVPEGGDTPEVPKGNLTIKVDMESSRSTLDGLSPEWAEGDVLSAVNATGNYRLWLVNAATGEFSGDVEGDYPFLIAYPYNEDITFSSGTATLSVPSTQTLAYSQNVAPGALVAAAVLSSGNSVTLKNLVSLVKLELGRGDVSSVSLSSTTADEPLSGTIRFSAANPDAGITITSGTDAVTLEPEGDHFEPGTYWMSVIPRTVSGVNFTFSKANDGGTHKTKSKVVSTTFARSGSLNFGTFLNEVTYTISNKAELIAWKNARNTFSPWDKVLITDDIDLEGDYWPGVDFSGEMDGGGHAITNIQINADRKWVCFFSSVSGYVHDLTMGSLSDDSYFTSTATYGQVPAGGGTAITDAYVGPVGQVQNGGRIENITNYVPVTASGDAIVGAGGICAYSYGAQAEGLLNYGSVSVSSDVHSTNCNIGGIIGYNKGDVACQAIGCENFGEVSFSGTCNSLRLGGIVGTFNPGENSLTDCENHGNCIIASTATITNDLHLGGIVGYWNSASQGGSLSGCINDAAKVANRAGSCSANVHCGGLIGFIFSSLEVSDCSNVSAVENSTECNWIHIGGIAGDAAYACTYSRCDNEGPVSFSGGQVGDNDVSVYGGGILGYDYGGGSYTSCTNSGSVAAEATSTATGKRAFLYLGGIIGYNRTVRATLTSCTNTGNISSEAYTSNDLSNVGGLLGVADDCGTDISSCSSRCSVNAVNGSTYAGVAFGRILPTSACTVQSTGVSGTAQGTALTAGNWSNAGKFYGNKKDNVNLVLAGTNSCYFIP